MAERPDEYELPEVPRTPIDDESNEEYIRIHRPSNNEISDYNYYRLDRESFKNFKIRQQLIDSNRVNPRSSFMDGRHTEVKILKKDILTKILDLPYDDKDVDNIFKDIKLEPVDNYTYRVYYKGDEIVKYNSKFKFYEILSRYYLDEFKSIYNEKYKRKEMETDFSVKKDLSAIDLEVRQSESEEHHREMDRLKTRINELENEKMQESQKVRNLQDQLRRARQQQNISGYDYRDEIIRDLEQRLSQTLESLSNKDRIIGGLMDQLNKMKEDTTNEIEALNESLQIKSTQIIETQNEFEYLKEKIEDLEDEIKSGEKDNEKLNKKLNELKEKYNKEVDELKKQRDSYKKEKEELEKRLEQNIDSRFQDVKTLVEERDRAIKEKDKSISFQESLKTRIDSLESSVKTLETHNASLKLISEDQKMKLEEARNEITKKENLLEKTINNRDEMINSMKEEMDDMEEENNDIRKSLTIKQKEFDALETEFKDTILQNSTNIDRLTREKEDVERRLQYQSQLTERVSDQDDELTRQLLQKSIELENLELENQNLTTELDGLRSRHRDFVSESETTSQNNKREILKLKTRVEELENDRVFLDSYVNELEESVDNYKGFLNDASEDKKKLKKEFEEECDKLNKEKEGLVKDLKNKSKDESDLRNKLFQNENDYSRLLQKYKKVNQDIESIVVEKEKTLERERILKEEIKYKDSRIKAKDGEVNEKMVENEKLKKQIEDASLNIKNSSFYEEQFEQKKKELEEKTMEYNKLVQLANRQDIDKGELIEEIRILQQEIADVRAEKELAQSKILPPETIEQMKHDIRNLNKLLDEKEKESKEDRKKIRGLEGDKKNSIDNFNRLKETSTRRMERMKEHYEKELENQRKKLVKTISPGELKALNIFLEDLDIKDYDKVDYDAQIKKLRSAREKFKRLIDDPSTDRAHKLQYKYLDDLMQYRIDFLNIEFKKPIETVKGRDYLIRVDNSWSPLGMVKRILLAMKDNPGTTMSLALTVVSNLAFGIFYFVSTSASYSKKSVVNVTRKIVQVTRPIRPIKVVKKVEPAQKIEPVQKVEPQKTKPSQKVEPQKTKPSQKVEPSRKVKPDKNKTADVVAGGSILYNIFSNIPSYALSFAEKIISFIDWTVQNFYKLILSGIIVSVTLYNMYGEQMSFPILAFWSFVLANAIVFATTLTRILPSWIVG